MGTLRKSIDAFCLVIITWYSDDFIQKHELFIIIYMYKSSYETILYIYTPYESYDKTLLPAVNVTQTAMSALQQSSKYLLYK